MSESPDNLDSNLIDQAELDRLEAEMLAAQGGASSSAPVAAAKDHASPVPAPAPAPVPATPAVAPPTPAAAPQPTPQPQAKMPVAGIPTVVGAEAPAAPADATPLEMAEFAEPEDSAELSNIDLLDDVDLDVKIELGRTQMYIEEVLRLGEGSVVELDKLAGDPVDVYVNDRLVARGEVLVLNDNFCVRISDIISVNPVLEESRK
jgi:flagellar motor switch protein FliN/FliY